MNTSKKYIEMCRRAEEIQEAFKGNKGDFYSYQETKNSPLRIGVFGGGICGDIDHEDLLLIKDKLIWLPRQDQLQEIICQERTLGAQITAFFNFAKENIIPMILLA